MGVIGDAVFAGMLVAMVGTIPRNIAFFANFRYFTSVPWAVPLTAVYLWYFWRYVRGEGPPDSTVETRRVTVGLLAKGQAEIREGLAEGDVVVVRAGAFVRDGDRIRSITAAEPSAKR